MRKDERKEPYLDVEAARRQGRKTTDDRGRPAERGPREPMPPAVDPASAADKPSRRTLVQILRKRR